MAPSLSRTPTRTCVGCRQACSPAGLVRVVAPDDRVQVATRQSEGRGAWLHPQASCVEKAIKTRAFSRAFKRAVTAPEAAELVLALVLAVRPGATASVRL